MMITPTLLFLQVEGDAHHAVGKLDQLLGAHIGQAAHAGDPVAGFEDRTDIADFQFGFEGFDLALKIGGNLTDQIGHCVLRDDEILSTDLPLGNIGTNDT